MTVSEDDCYDNVTENKSLTQGEVKMTKLSKMNINELREYAVSLGADRKKLYGSSKNALIIIINKLR